MLVGVEKDVAERIVIVRRSKMTLWRRMKMKMKRWMNLMMTMIFL